MKKTLMLVLMLSGALVGCHSDRLFDAANPNAPAHTSGWLAAIPEVDGEPEPGARIAAIDPANAVWLVFKISDVCSGTAATAASQRIAFYSGTASGTVVAASVKSANGYSTSTIKQAKYNTYLKKKVDKTQPLSLLVYNPESKSWKALRTLAVNTQTFDFINYFKLGYEINCDRVYGLDLTDGQGSNLPLYSIKNANDFFVVDLLDENNNILVANVQAQQTAVAKGAKRIRYRKPSDTPWSELINYTYMQELSTGSGDRMTHIFTDGERAVFEMEGDDNELAITGVPMKFYIAF